MTTCLGGTHNYEVDRQAAEQIRRGMPELADAAWANRGFHGRAAVWMAASQGIGQFLDLGSGLPTQNNTHQAVQPGHARRAGGLRGRRPDRGAYGAPLLPRTAAPRSLPPTCGTRTPSWSIPELRRLIDFSQPVGVLMTAVLQFIADGSDPWGAGAAVHGRDRPRVATWPCRTSPMTGSAPQITESHSRCTSGRRATSSRGPMTRSRGSSTGWNWCRPARRRARHHLRRPVGRRGPGAADSDGSRAFCCGVARTALTGGKPTVESLGIDVSAAHWQRSGAGDGAIEVALVGPAGEADAARERRGS